MSPIRSDFQYGPVRTRAEQERLRDLIVQCFQFPVSRWDNFAERLGRGNFRRVTREGRLVGGLGIYFLGQWFGGRSVPTGAIAAVGVWPEDRASGAAFELMAATLRELREKSIPLSTLYPATQRLYRKAGYEQAGFLCQFALPARSIHSKEREVSVRAADPGRHEIFHKPYDERARRGSGQLDRSTGMWQRAVTLATDPLYAYIFGSEENPEGYILYSQHARESGYDLRIKDFAVSTPRAARSLWAFLSDHRSLARDISWYGPPDEPLLALLPEQDARMISCERWFLRVVDVKAALEARGYPHGLEDTLVLVLQDEVLPENEGRFLLRVSGGQGAVEREEAPRRKKTAAGAGAAGAAGAGGIRLHVRALAPLYSGMFTPAQLEDLGWIEGDPESIASASRIFAGPVPWMTDGF